VEKPKLSAAIEKLFTAYDRTFREHEESIKPIQAEIEQLEAIRHKKVAALDEQIELLQSRIDYLYSIQDYRRQSIDTTIRHLALKLADSLKCAYGAIVYTSEYTKRSWNLDALDGYAAAHLEIEKFRKTSHVKSSIRVTYLKGE
jgi:hypothetical protein